MIKKLCAGKGGKIVSSEVFERAKRILGEL